MIEQIGTPGFETVSRPNRNATAIIEALRAAGNDAPVIAEIGVGIGATTLAMAKTLDNRGELHLFDFQTKLDELVGDLANLGFTNVRGFGNSDKHWDSYNWTLGRLIQAGKRDVYDYIYLDGAHTFAVDALAFVLCDRLLKPGGYLEFDDYSWCFAASRWMQETRDQFMTEEQIRTPQVKMVVDMFLNGNAGYSVVQPNRLYRKAGGPTDTGCGGTDVATETVEWRGQAFRVIRHPAVRAAAAEFRSDFEAGTLQFFDAALPMCDRMVDVGAYVGLMSLYAARRVDEVCAFEASPGNADLLARNVAANPDIKDRTRLFRHGLGERDELVPLYGKGPVDSGSSIFRTVERGAIVNGMPEATVELRAADPVLRSIGVTSRTLLKIDIEGAEYLVVPAIASLLAETRPYLHLSFHPFNLVAGDDEYLTTVLRLRRGLQVAEALAFYRYMYFYDQGQWQCIAGSDRMTLLRRYLLQPKPVSRAATAQYGFIDAVGFSDIALPVLGEPVRPA
jgi:FkbM family methyltransferase